MSMIIVVPPDQFLLEISEEDTEKSVGEKLVKKYFPNVSAYSFKFSDPDYYIEPGTAAYCEFTPKMHSVISSYRTIHNYCVGEDKLYCLLKEDIIKVYDANTLEFLYDILYTYPGYKHELCISYQNNYIILYSPNEFQIINPETREIVLYMIDITDYDDLSVLVKIRGDKIIVVENYRKDLVIYDFRGKRLRGKRFIEDINFLHDDYIEAENKLYDYDYNFIKILDDARIYFMKSDIFVHYSSKQILLGGELIVTYKEFTTKVDYGILDCSINKKLIFLLYKDHISIYNKELNYIKNIDIKFKPEKFCLSTENNIILFEKEKIHSIPIEN